MGYAVVITPPTMPFRFRVPPSPGDAWSDEAAEGMVGKSVNLGTGRIAAAWLDHGDLILQIEEPE